MLCYIILSASTDWGCAVQIAAAINIANQKFVATQMQTLYVTLVNSVRPSAVFCLTNIKTAGSMWQ